MNTPHIHHDLIILWAKGAVIEEQSIDGDWFIQVRPTWSIYDSFRVKPEPKPDVLRYGIASVKTGYGKFGGVESFGDANLNENNNLKLTFHGDTGKLIKAEVV